MTFFRQARQSAFNAVARGKYGRWGDAKQAESEQRIAVGNGIPREATFIWVNWNFHVKRGRSFGELHSEVETGGRRPGEKEKERALHCF